MIRIILYLQLLVSIFMITSCAQVYKPLVYDDEVKPSVNFHIWLTEPDVGIYTPFASTIINYERVQPDPGHTNGSPFLLRLEYRVRNNFEAKRIIEHWSHTGNLVKVQYQP
ncbi:hypothetical protein ACLOAU_09690 [Niabella sp. CJ426]|uniref:hypothetical protein n=1 Tax=Niabella sp. CJ426 TaxID=3393740 RepID=UPI003CFC76CC